MTEDECYEGEFTDGELDCQANLADYRRAAEEFYLEYQDQMDEQTREKFRRSGGTTPLNILARVLAGRFAAIVSGLWNPFRGCCR